MIYIYTPRASNGARDLAEGIMLYRGEGAGVAARRTKGQALRNVTQADSVICWGNSVALPQGVRSLNNVPGISKFQEAETLARAGVRTVQVSRTRPNVRAARQPFVDNFFELPVIGRPAAGRVNATEAADLARRLNEFVTNEGQRRRQWDAQPAVPDATWLPRRNNHMGGADLLNPPANPDFYSKKENIVEEYRLHMFKGKSIRAGRKIQQERPGQQPHAWIRSFDAGWIISYNGFESNRQMRELAASALTALNLDFGAVDMGRLADGTYIVLEVNRAPGVEGGTVEAYARHIIDWHTGRNQEARNGRRQQ